MSTLLAVVQVAAGAPEYSNDCEQEDTRPDQVGTGILRTQRACNVGSGVCSDGDEDAPLGPTIAMVQAGA